MGRKKKNNLSSSQVCEWLLRYIDAEGVKVMDFSLDPHHHHHRRTPSDSIRRSISVRFCGIFQSCCSSDRKNNPNTSTSASAPCKNIVRAGRCTVRSPALCADTHTHTHTHTHTEAVIGRISGKGNLRQARAIWGDDKILWGAEESVAAGENDLSEFFFFFFCLVILQSCSLPAAERCHCQFPHTHTHTHTPRDCS